MFDWNSNGNTSPELWGLYLISSVTVTLLFKALSYFQNPIYSTHPNISWVQLGTVKHHKFYTTWTRFFFFQNSYAIICFQGGWKHWKTSSLQFSHNILAAPKFSWKTALSRGVQNSINCHHHPLRHQVVLLLPPYSPLCSLPCQFHPICTHKSLGPIDKPLNNFCWGCIEVLLSRILWILETFFIYFLIVILTPTPILPVSHVSTEKNL